VRLEGADAYVRPLRLRFIAVAAQGGEPGCLPEALQQRRSHPAGTLGGKSFKDVLGLGADVNAERHVGEAPERGEPHGRRDSWQGRLPGGIRSCRPRVLGFDHTILGNTLFHLLDREAQEDDDDIEAVKAAR
jgi:hypothetical protein